MTKEELLKNANKYELQNEWQPALEIYTTLSSQYPDELTFLEKVAWCASRLPKYDVAIQKYTLLTELQPQSAKWYYCVGYQYYMQKKWPIANKWFEKAIDLYPEYLVVKYRYAYSLRQLCGSMLVLKKDEFWKSLKQLSECDQIWGNYTTKQKKQNEATYSSICFQHAKLLVERNHLDEAITYLTKALSIRPEYEEYKYQLSKTYLSLGNIKKAREILPYNSTKYFVKELEIELLIAEDNLKEAISKYNSLLKYRKKDYLFRNLGMLYFKTHNLKDAIVNILRAESINKQNHITQFTKGQVLFEAGFLVAAKETVEHSISLKKSQYSSEYKEATQLLHIIQNRIEDESYSMDNETDLESFLHEDSSMNTQQRFFGEVANYNTERGFGFIEYNNIRYFFHISNVPKYLQDEISDGMILFFSPEKTPKGLSAKNIADNK